MSKGPFKNYVTGGGGEGGIRNLQILVTNSDKGGREVGRNRDILVPKNSFLNISVFQYHYKCRLLCHRNFHHKEMYCPDPSTLVGNTGNHFLLHMHENNGYYDPCKIFFPSHFVERKSYDANYSCTSIFFAIGQYNLPKFMSRSSIQKKVCHYLAGDKGREGGVLIW